MIASIQALISGCANKVLQWCGKQDRGQPSPLQSELKALLRVGQVASMVQLPTVVACQHCQMSAAPCKWKEVHGSPPVIVGPCLHHCMFGELVDQRQTKPSESDRGTWMPGHLKHSQARPRPEVLLINLSALAPLCASPISGCWPPERQVQHRNSRLIRVLHQPLSQHSGHR